MKYILYKTINLTNNHFYIGVHGTQTPLEFDKYLGNGIYINRPNTYEKAKTKLQSAVKEFGIKNFRRYTIAIYDTAEEAYFVESLIVNDAFLSRPDVYNMIKGGKINRVSGREVHKYNAKTGEYIQSYKSLEQAAKSINSSASTICHSIKEFFKLKGFIFNFEKFDILDLSKYNFKTKQVVYRYTKEGRFDKKYESLNAAGKDSLDTAASYIQQAASLGYLVKNTYYFSFYGFDSYDKARQHQIKKRSVYKYDENGNFLEEYVTQEEAEKKNKYSNITKSIRLKSKDINNCYWSLEKLTKFNVPCKRIKKPVVQLDEDDNILKKWESVNSCAREVGVAVKLVLLGKYKYHKGYKYKYIDN